MRVSTTPTLSVTLLNHNYGRYLAGCLESILGQTYRDFELILIDDCSTDDSLDVVRPYLADPRIRLVTHAQNAGFVSSLLEGVRLSRAPYLSVISADDAVAANTAFERQMALLEAHPETGFCYSAWRYVDGNGARVSDVVPWPTDHVWPGEAEFRPFCTRYYVLHTGTIVRRTAYDAVGGYDTSIVYTLDNTLWAVLCGAGSVAYVAEPLYAYRTHGANMSHRPEAVRATLREFLRLVDAGFAGLPDGPTRSDRRLRRRARQAALASVATMQIFGGNHWSGWRALAYAARMSPLETLLQRRVLSLIARTLLGRRGFGAARGLLASAVG
jgi:glycosyltransferase involved in cell wall biosynthesis